MSSTLASLSRSDQNKLAFWEGFAEYVKEKGQPFPAWTPRAEGFHPWGIGRSKFWLLVRLNLRDGRIAVELNLLGSPEIEDHYRELMAQRAPLEEALGFSLAFRDSGSERYVGISRQMTLDTPVQWREAYRWALEHMIPLDRVLRPAVVGLSRSRTTGARPAPAPPPKEAAPRPVVAPRSTTVPSAPVAPPPIMVVPAPARPPVPIRQAPVGPLRDWLETIENAEFRQVLTHIALHGSVTEEEVVHMAGGAGRARRFSAALDDLAPSTAPIQVRVEMIGTTKRYIRTDG